MCLWCSPTGSCRFSGGDRYTGQWEAGQRHGVGGCIFTGGDKYQGEWAADQRSGKGVCEYANGDVYQGAAQPRPPACVAWRRC